MHSFLLIFCRTATAGVVSAYENTLIVVLTLLAQAGKCTQWKWLPFIVQVLSTVHNPHSKRSTQQGAGCITNPIFWSFCFFSIHRMVPWLRRTPAKHGPELSVLLWDFHFNEFLSAVGAKHGGTDNIKHDEERMGKRAVTTSLCQHLASSYLFNLAAAGK